MHIKNNYNVIMHKTYHSNYSLKIYILKLFTCSYVHGVEKFNMMAVGITGPLKLRHN